MGFNKCFIPDYKELIEYYNSVDLETFINRFKRYDAYIGDSASMQFLKEKQKEFKSINENKKNEF